MDVLTGPQSTPEQREELAELAGFHGLTPAETGLPWWEVDHLYRAPGWAQCPLALADVAIADAFGIKALDLRPA